MPVTKTNKPLIKTQLVTSKEFGIKHAFNQDNIHLTKMLFEGAGGLVRSGLYKQFRECYEHAVFVVASNKLPGSEQDGQKPDQWNTDVWHPLCTRVDFTCFTKSHKHDSIFPYSEK